ncbi:MAG TPA: T9SS type A sorting domain-containing protein [Parafilimonas sp.]|nr:T9SS type A sorting domain-containing protein [Parafilimonas sp.]
MRNQLLLAIVLLGVTTAVAAQNADSTTKLYGVRQSWGGIPLTRSQYPEIHGLVGNFKWKDIEPFPNVWNWQQLDSDIASHEAGLPFQLMIFTKDNAPDWLYTTGGVPKVIEYNSTNDSIGISPYYPDPNYKFFFKRMIDTVAKHVKAWPANLKLYLSIQACLGEELDYIGYRNVDQARATGLDQESIHVDPQYKLSSNQLAVLFKEFTRYYYYAYVGSGIGFLCNPSCADANSQSNIKWVLDSLPGANLRYAVPGKSFQINDEFDRMPWLLPVLNAKYNGAYIRANSDLANNDANVGWFKIHPTRNMFSLFTSMLHYGLELSDQMPTYIKNPAYRPAFDFFNRYAGEKDTATAAHAMCGLHDGLDASDSTRFPSAIYGKAVRSNVLRYMNIQNAFASKGALLMDTSRVYVKNNGTAGATGTNDVGWRIITGNYERYIHQINPNGTSVGYWNVNALNDTNSIYGRFGRGFDVAHGKNALFFDVDNGFLHYAPLNSQSRVMISVTYLDSGNGSWQLFYDAQDTINKPSIAVNCANTGKWKTTSVTLADGYFGNRNDSMSDFYIRNTGAENVIFSLVEFERPNVFVNNNGLFCSNALSFDTVCVNTVSRSKFVVVSGAFLNSSDVTVGPFNGYQFSFFADSAFKESLSISNYGTSFQDTIYVRFQPTDSVSYTGNCLITGGGVNDGTLSLKGAGINTRPELSATVKNVSCNGAKDGAIDLNLSGGIQPFTYFWTNTGSLKDSNEDIRNLSPSTYTVTVGSYMGCSTASSYVITEPNALTMILTQDSMVCKGGTTSVHVSASGGTAPYTGVGDFAVSYGKQTFTVVDAHGCIDTASIYVFNGTGVPPAKPAAIICTLADAVGLCGGGKFSYAIDPVPGATSYTWLPPAGCSISSISTDGTQILLSAPLNFTADSLSVTANNACGSSPALKKSLSALPGKPGAISGPTTVVPLQSGIAFSVTQTGALGYTWTVAPGATITSGQGTSAITVNWGNTSGNINVRAVNACGSSAGSSMLSITVANYTLVSSVPSLPPYDTICINGLSAYKFFNLAGSGLDGSNVIVKALPGFKVSTTGGGTYTDSLTITNYGTSIKQNIYVKFNPVIPDSYNGNIKIGGGGSSPAYVSVTGVAVNSSPALSANITNISCRGAANGGIDLSLSGGMAPFAYRWTGPGSYDSSAQDISGLNPSTYTVTVTSYVGCKTSSSYLVTQPDALTMTLTADSVICKDATTIVHVRASGGTAPYVGTGDFNVAPGKQTYTVTDAHGCTQTQSIWIANGSLIAPAKPAPITGAYADSVGLCGGGNFQYRTDLVSTATSYKWIAPSGCSIRSISSDGTQIVLTVPSGFTVDTLRVAASNVCGASVPQAKTLYAVPGRPGPVSGPTSVKSSQTGVVYKTTAVSGLNYTWSVPGSVTIVSGQGSGTLKVNWGTKSGTISVLAKNNCGTSTYGSSLNVSVGTALVPVQQATYASAATNKLIVQPNPAKDIAHISFSATETQNFSILLTDMNGKLLQSKKGIAVKGENTVSIYIRNYASGIYLVSILTGDGKSTRVKLLKD